MKKYNLSEIMKRAWELVKKAGATISDALKEAWKEAKNMAEKIENAVIDTFASYNTRRYSLPWVCKMDEHGKYNFSEKIGTYSVSYTHLDVYMRQLIIISNLSAFRHARPTKLLH